MVAVTTETRSVHGTELLAYTDGIRETYRDAFRAPPYDEDEVLADLYLGRLAEDVRRPGFTAALALDGGRVLGFATAWTTPVFFPSGRWYPPVAAALGGRRTRGWLCGATEVDELAVRGTARGRGLGTALLTAVTATAPDGRCWLLTSVRAEPALRLYLRLGWRQATYPTSGGDGLAVFLGPRHPAVLRPVAEPAPPPAPRADAAPTASPAPTSFPTW